MLFTVLPLVVQNRIPKIPSLRRSISDLRGRGNQGKGGAPVSPHTPPPRYTSQDGVSTHSADSIESSDAESINVRDETSDRPVSSSSFLPPFPFSEAESGIAWKYANQGASISLLTQAYQESNALARNVHDASGVLTRQLYLHGMSYLLRGLPEDLTQEETLSLQAAMPAEMLALNNDGNAKALVPASRNATARTNEPEQPPSILHRMTAAVVFQTFLLGQLLLPYIKLFIGHAYRWEQEHRFTRKLLNGSITTVDELGRRTVQLSQTVCQMNDGKVGQAINDVTLWWVQGLTGGIQQGVSEGIVVVGMDHKQDAKARVEKVD
ncbi:hypothetical protein EJ04DRAFT_426171 [Polyplosphaeria fusca]|uniref:Uncharacterized protein n=1 Tax=Polyplosphaeria fusca TaxID=682080 RepID=A0A9P4V7Z2_9PLEO|nr:hypothetical protein EJ04DRAFT_426171 [Polyplosphaeria fusca]